MTIVTEVKTTGLNILFSVKRTNLFLIIIIINLFPFKTQHEV
jgi:hypothetical protein